jgi:hypothetical protein
VAIPIGHTGTTLYYTATDFATALNIVRTSIAAKRKAKCRKTQDISKTTLIHYKMITNTLLDKFCYLAQTRLLDIIAHRLQKLREQSAI